jgi:tetratricopeptide (TPR) repeat protein
LRAETEVKRLVMKRHLSFVAALGICVFAANTHAQQIKSETGSVAIGGSVTSSTIIIGIPQENVDELVRDAKRPLEELTTQQRDNIALLKEKLDLNERQVRAALGVLGENDIPPERLAAKLVEIAERFKFLQATASAQPGDDPKIAGLKTDAQKAIEAGELTKADALLADVETEQRLGLDRLAVDAAETSARRGEIALTRLRYAEAAKHFANAAGAFPANSSHEDKRISYVQRQANAFYLQGAEFGDNGALLSAIEGFKRLLEMTPRERVPLVWAATQNNLGTALSRIGERQSGTTKLEEAVVAYREALKELTRERVPPDWAMTQNNLGAALYLLGERESGTAKLEEAVVAYREALKERTREQVPLDWASTQHNLGYALQALGERESGTAKLEEAVVAYREALKERTRDQVPLEWAMTQNNLGNALFRLEEHKSGTTKLEEAVVAYREVLKARTRERVPLGWAQTQHNLGTALQVIGERQGGTMNLEQAVLAFDEALRERTRERVPLDWASSLGNQGVALMVLADRRKDVAMAKNALSQINTALETMRRGGHAPNAAFYEQQLSKARAIVARLRGR